MGMDSDNTEVRFPISLSVHTTALASLLEGVQCIRS